MIRIDLKSDSIAIGEHITGQAVWQSSGSKQPRKIEVVCRKRLQGKKRTSSDVSSTTEENIGTRTQIAVPFDFEIDFIEPVSYDGKLFRVVWEIVATVDLPFAADEEETKVFTVKPAAWTAEQYKKWQEEKFDDEDEDEDEDDDEEVSESSPETHPEAR